MTYRGLGSMVTSTLGFFSMGLDLDAPMVAFFFSGGGGREVSSAAFEPFL